MPKIISVTGNIATGKSTLCTRLSQEFDRPAFLEDLQDNPALEQYYKNPTEWGYAIALIFHSRRIVYWQMAEQEGGFVEGHLCLTDIYCSTMYHKGYLREWQYKKLMTEYRTFLSMLEPKSFSIVLKADPEVLAKRVKDRGRVGEEKIPGTYIRDLDQRFKEWAAGVSDRIHIIDTTRKTPDEVYDEAAEIVRNLD